MTGITRDLDPQTQPILVPVVLAIEDLSVTIWPAARDELKWSEADRRVRDALRLALASPQCIYEQFETELKFLSRFEDCRVTRDATFDFLLDVRRSDGGPHSRPATVADEHALRQLLTENQPSFRHYLEARRDFTGKL
ncbi:hypothetical protein [Paenarthrobacter nicotinovorans]|jgi:hypothetical protein|uniref:hypothetical protein n=1 Tax=Paenarthrobacter nicotinovorans TaxID=29320 RepID=UPI003D67EAE2